MSKRIYKQSIIVLLIAVLLSFFLDGRTLPFSIIVGGIIGILNFRGLSWGVHGLLNTEGAGGKLLFFSFLRIVIIFSIIVVLIYFQAVNVLGLLVGFTVVFLVIIKESFLSARS